ncbi:MAG: hypothetical protein ABSF35_21875 [Polyangia bacterium]
MTYQLFLAATAAARSRWHRRPVEAIPPRGAKTIEYECLDQFVIFGERHVRYLIREFVEHYHTERFHQGIGGELIKSQPGSATMGQEARLPAAHASAGF